MAKRILLITSIILALSACAPKTAPQPAPAEKPVAVQQMPAPVALPAAIPSQQPYRIGVGDEVELKFFFTPELNDRLTVRPDGKISIMFAQDIQAADHTADELADSIRGKMAGHVTQTDMVVIVRTFASQKIYVGGEVSKPGALQLSGREDVLQAINEAGWVTPLASHDVVMLVRRNAEGKDGVYPINFRKIVSGEDMSQNVQLMAGDLVLVPPSGIVAVDRWVDQNIRQIIPINTGVFLNSR